MVGVNEAKNGYFAEFIGVKVEFTRCDSKLFKE